MELDFTIGIEEKKTITVSSDDTAVKYGSGLVEVFATPAMIGLMENTAQSSVAKFLPAGCVTVGIEVNIKHTKATPVGMSVRCESKLVAIEGRKLFFEVQAWDEDGQIGAGTHARVVVDKEKFMSKI